MFITHLLFSSPRLRFSEAQKKAVLSWANSLKAPDVPTLSALKKCQARILELVGNPTEQVTSHAGNVFHINDIGKAIAKVCAHHFFLPYDNLNFQDYANPLARFSMSDYPMDGGAGMSQVKHGEKMLIDLPQSTTTPTVRVNGKIFYVGELLQFHSGAYFIPERFFEREAVPDDPSNRVLHALGWDVERTNVS